jgi:acyl-CoA carboxylase epsilon subunit
MTAPLFHVRRGAPTAEELAALTAVLAAKANRAAASRRHAGPPAWGVPGAAHRRPLPPPGPGAWRRAATVAGGADA